MTRTQPMLGFDRLGTGPAVMLLHPTGLGPAVLLPFAQRLALSHTVVIPHRRGYGSSVTMTAAASLDDHLTDLIDLMHTLDLGPCSLVGVSAGATLAIAYVAQNPDHPATVLAHEPLLGPIAPLLHGHVAGRIDRLLERADRPVEVSLFTSELVGVHTWNALPAAWREGVEANRNAALAEVGFYATFAADDAVLNRLGECPNLFTSVGTRSSEARQEAAGVLADHAVRVLRIEGAGHLAPVDAPAAFEAALAAAQRQTGRR